MLKTSAPTPIQIPFAKNAGGSYIRPVPVASQIGVTPGAASYTDGFPPVNFVDPLAGGVPFSGKDTNGVLNDITNALQWEQFNGSAAYSALVSTAIGGYPLGAILQKIGAAGYWQSTADNNITNPDTGGAGWHHFNPIDSIATIALTNTNVTLSVVQYSASLISLTGTLTANVQIIMPNHIGHWKVINSTTGLFTVTVKTAAGTGVVIDQGYMYGVFGDGTNIIGQGITKALADMLYLPLAGNALQTVSIATATAAAHATRFDQAIPIRTTSITPLPATNTGIVVTHTLGVIPAIAILELVCLTADAGYAVGDVVQNSALFNGSNSVSAPLIINKNTTSVGCFIPTSNLLAIAHKTTGAILAATVASWAYRFVLR
jgi:hypothetical protein